MSKPTKGVKYDQGKNRVDLIPVECLIGLAKIYTMGAKKYSENGWKDGMEWNRIYGAILRHLFAFWCGEDRDKESGLNHLLHAAWGCFTLYWYWLYDKGTDTRWVGKEEQESTIDNCMCSGCVESRK